MPLFGRGVGRRVEVSGTFGVVPIMIMDYAGALVATALLVVDPVFLITTVLDLGIDAVQHFLAVAAMLLFVRFHR